MILAVSLNLVVGFLGELSLGHAGFMCVGAYTGAKIAGLLSAGGAWSSLLGSASQNPLIVLIVCLVIGGAAAAICGVIIGLPALRLRGDYLAIVTLAFGEIVRSLFRNMPEEQFGGNLGLTTVRYDRYQLFIIGFALVIVTLAIIQNFIRSKHGRAVTSIRDSEIAARACGINVTKYKLMVFTISAFFAGIAGVLFSFSNYKVQPGTFDYNYSIEILVMVVLGGMGSLGGSLVSAALITFLNDYLQITLTGDKAVLKDLLYALILILLIIYRNAPALKTFREKVSIKNLFNRFRKPKDPSHITDDEHKWDRVPTKIEIDEVLSIDVKVTSPYTPDKPQKEK
jgi:branched-chain amino acid transport system permease protein